MQKDPYLILGVAKDATQEEIRAAYERLREEYQSQLFEEGEVGNTAAKKLDELERAYHQCLEDKANDFHFTEEGASGWGEIEEMIKDGNLEGAQSKLDNIEMRDGYWHYLQAIIYHKRGWNVESKKQLDISLTLDEDNEKYKQARERLNKVLSGANAEGASSANGSAAEGRAGYSRPDQEARRAANDEACCNTCSTLICCDCCCECMGGDLIPCC